MKKSILSIFVTLSMLFSFLPTALAADNSSAAYEITPNVSTVAQGDNVTFTFDVKNVEMVSSISAKISYDPSKLIYVSSERGNIYNYDYTASTGKILRNDADKNAVKALLSFNANEYHDISNDTFFKVTFMVANSVEPGDYSDYITVDEVSAFRGAAEFKLNGSVPEITVVEGDKSYPLLVTADKSTVSMGDDVTYTISTTEAVDLDALQLMLAYDKSLLEFKEGTLIEGDTSEINADAIVWGSGEVKEISGEIARLTFTALKNGTADITAAAESAPSKVKANFPSVSIISDVSITVTSDKDYLKADDTVTYTVSLDNAAAVMGLELDLDFSGINIKDVKADLGESLKNIEAVANETAFDGNVFKLVFASDSIAEIPAGEIAKFSFTLASDLSGAYKPAVADSSATFGTGDSFTADVNIASVSPTPVTALMRAVPDYTSVQAGDTVTYTVTLDKAINPTGFEAHLDIDKTYVDGDITVKSVSDKVDAKYNSEKGDVTAVAFDFGEKVALSGDLFTVSFKTKADKNVVLRPEFREIVVTGASVSASVVPVSIYAQSSAAVNISSSEEYALPGSTVKYTFDLKDAKALKLLNIDVEYDPAIYSNAAVKTADAAPLTAEKTVDKTSGKINVIFMGENALSGDKDGLVTIEFKVADEPAPGPDGVKIDVKSDADTKLTVKNNAKTSVVSSYGHLSVNTSKTYVFNSPSAEIVEVTVAVEDTTDLEDLSFELTYDKNMFSRISTPAVNEGAEFNVIEEGRIAYVYTGDAIESESTKLLTFKLYPYDSASGYTDIKAVEVATPSAIDTVKASKRLYVYSTAETNQIIAVQKAINAIGEITADNYKNKEAGVSTARALYDILTDVQKEKLADEAKTLAAAETAIAAFKAAEEKAAAVDELIKAIGAVTEDSEAAIKAAREAYDALDDTAKAFVKELAALTAAEEAYAKIVADKAAAAAVDELVDAIGAVTADSFTSKLDGIKAAEDAYAALTDDQKAYVKKADVLKAAREAYDAFYAAMKNFKVTVSAGADGYTASIVNQKSVSDDPVVVLAVYDRAGVLVKVTSTKASAAAQIAAAADAANTSVKVYVWDSLDGMTPYTNVEIAY